VEFYCINPSLTLVKVYELEKQVNCYFVFKYLKKVRTWKQMGIDIIQANLQPLYFSKITSYGRKCLLMYLHIMAQFFYLTVLATLLLPSSFCQFSPLDEIMMKDLEHNTSGFLK